MPYSVTISASYGARGDQVARGVADRLGLPFLDRAIPASAAHQLAESGDIAESLDERVPGRWERMAIGFAVTALPAGPIQLPIVVVQTPEEFRAADTEMMRGMADTSGAVILGRAGMVVLGGRPDVLCVCLDGPVDARIAQVVSGGKDEAVARMEQREIDKARQAYARVFFAARQDDPRLYHVMLDSTVLSAETCVRIIVRSAYERFEAILA
jgi:hypothetical protein